MHNNDPHDKMTYCHPFHHPLSHQESSWQVKALLSSEKGNDMLKKCEEHEPMIKEIIKLIRTVCHSELR